MTRASERAPSKLPLLVVTSPLPGNALSLCEGRARVRVLRGPRLPGEEGLIRALRLASGAVTLLADPVTESVLSRCPHLRVVANCAVGTENIDLEAASRFRIAVTNTPDVLTEATADLTWALILGVARRVHEGDRMVRRGVFKGWSPTMLLGMDLRGKTLGVVGMGRIGQAVARRAPAFGMTVAYAQRHRLRESLEGALAARYVPLHRLVAEADVLTLHCPLTTQTRHLMDRERLGSMKAGAILINTGRGPLVDEAALVEYLREGRLAGAGLDVYEREPLLEPGLKNLHNTMLLPHLGSATAETRAAMARTAVADALAVMEGRPPAHPVVYATR